MDTTGRRSFALRRGIGQSAGRSLDGLLVGLPPLVMLGVFALPEALRQSLAFRYGQPTVVSAYAAHFVHFDIGHLLGNLISYLLLASLCFALVRAADRRRQFRVVLVGLLLGFPFSLSALNLAVPGPGIGYGSSGLVMGVFGYLPLALWTYGTARLEWPGLRYAPGVFFLGTALIAAALNLGQVGTLLVVASLTVVGGYLVGLWRASRVGTTPTVPSGQATLLVTLSVTLFLTFPAVAFPAVPAGDGGVLSVYVHFLGYALGFVVVFTSTCIEDHVLTRA